jgi:hypothetical protein
MRIAIIAWGSLIWDPRTLKVAAKEWPRSGPVLPLEFSRVSLNGRLTLVVDCANGAAAQTWVNTSALSDLGAAIENLRERENMPNTRRIETVERRHGRVRARDPRLSAVDIVEMWITATDFDAALWTALPPNFAEKTGSPFSPQAALAYVQGLRGGTQREAIRYIREAPAEIATPVRALVTTAFPRPSD